MLPKLLEDANCVSEIFVTDRSDPANSVFFDRYGPTGSLAVKCVNPDYCYERYDTFDDMRLPITAFDAIWLRMDYPISDDFIAHLKKTFPWSFFIEDPDALMRTDNKAWLADIAADMGDLMPPVRLCRSAEDVDAFKKIHPDLVLKQLRSYGGKGVVRYRTSGDTEMRCSDDVRHYMGMYGPCLAMRYLASPNQSDNRILVTNRAILGAFKRRPGESWQCNMSSGGTAETTELDDRELEIVGRVQELMRQENILFCGIDTLEDEHGTRFLSEVNTLNVGGIRRAAELSSQPVLREAVTTIANRLHQNSGLILQLKHQKTQVHRGGLFKLGL